MTTTVTLNIEQSKNSKTKATTFTLQTENKSFINSIIKFDGNTITEAQMKILQDKMAVAGDAGVLEQIDMTPQEKINMAAMTRKYGNKYDIELITNNGKQFYKFTIKERYLRAMFGIFGGTRRKLSVADIKADLDLELKYSYSDGGGNNFNCSALKKYNDLSKNACTTSERHTGDDYEFSAGQSFIVPVEDVTFDF